MYANNCTRISACLLVALAVFSRDAAAAAVVTHPYTLTKTVPLGAPDRWDYVTFDPASKLVYAAHSSGIDVIDTATSKIVGRIPVPGANGVAIVPSRGKGYAGSREQKSVLVFDLASRKILHSLKADDDTDAVIYDPASRRVFVLEGDPASATVVNTDDDTVVMQLPLGGKPEFAAADGAGHLYVNIEDKHEIARVDTRALKIDARWPMNACASPHGLAIDAQAGRLFSTCANAKMIVLSTRDGQFVSTIPIGKRSDAAAFDPARNRAFSSNGEGSLTIVTPDQSGYSVLDTMPTEPLARTMTVDPESGRLFFLSAERVELDAHATDARRRYGVRPGTARLLIYDPG